VQTSWAPHHQLVLLSKPDEEVESLHQEEPNMVHHSHQHREVGNIEGMRPSRVYDDAKASIGVIAEKTGKVSGTVPFAIGGTSLPDSFLEMAVRLYTKTRINAMKWPNTEVIAHIAESGAAWGLSHTMAA